ncbi:MAG TPA: tRNA pseudouridine(55) synthase TruB [Allosphingosinicella sp.]|nr:tRNA pseudouridine(55) synthase TruB [Allosphingosinicella sp.]
MHGWLIIDKPIGIGSTPVVGAVKRALREGGYPKVKVGHGGTLDPLASGVLPVALGEATKLSGRMLDADKIYEFTIRLGEETDTLDAEGRVIARSSQYIEDSDVADVLASFVGAIRQVPPAYSAIKLGGKRAYDLARSGAEVPLVEREVTVHQLEYLEGWREDGLLHVTLRARVSKGTYIRSLARDIARASGSVGHVVMLRRTKAGPFTLEGAISLDKLSELAKARQLEQALLPLTAGLDDIPALSVTPDQARALRQGRKLAGIAAKPGLHLATELSVPVALVELFEGELRVVRGFNF